MKVGGAIGALVVCLLAVVAVAGHQVGRETAGSGCLRPSM